jgi:hypothetical protein
MYNLARAPTNGATWDKSINAIAVPGDMALGQWCAEATRDLKCEVSLLFCAALPIDVLDGHAVKPITGGTFTLRGSPEAWGEW